MVNLIDSKIIMTRKIHTCHGCSDKIPKGTKNIKSTTCADGDIYRLYYCLKCQKFYSEQCDKCGECFDYDDAILGFMRECQEKATANSPI